MKDVFDQRVVPTLISLWSAMLGGAVGAYLGLLGGTYVVRGVIGLTIGLICSVPLNLLMMGFLYMSLAWMHSDMDETPLGCTTSSELSGLLGAATGLLAAVLTPISAKPGGIAPRTFLICWTVSAWIPIILMLGLLRLQPYLDSQKPNDQIDPDL
jgi:hypothetical protein